jgi:hypothetical protein
VSIRDSVFHSGLNDILVLLRNILEERRYLLDSNTDEGREWGFGTTAQKTSYENSVVQEYNIF